MLGLIALSLALALTANLGANAECITDADCERNFNCMRLGIFQGRACVPKTCVEGAVQAMIEAGFDSTKWVEDIHGETGTRIFAGLSSNATMTLREAYERNPPPMDAFTRYYKACTDPTGEGGQSAAGEMRVLQPYYGVQWSAGAGILYSGQSLWLPERPDIQCIFNCLGFSLGAELGVASFLFSLFDVLALPEPEPIDDVVIPGIFCAQIVVLGPLQVRICWIDPIPIDIFKFVQVSIGAQIGAGLGGIQWCVPTIEGGLPPEPFRLI